MICKNCGQKIDDDSLFCEHCGENISDLSASNNDSETIISNNRILESEHKTDLIIMAISFALLLLVLILVLIHSNGSINYYKKINNELIRNFAYFQFEGDQLISSVEIDYNTNQLKCNISPNNIDLKYSSIIVEDDISVYGMYCVYDLIDNSLSLEAEAIYAGEYHYDVINSENAYNYIVKDCSEVTSKYMHSGFNENAIYKFVYTVWFGASEPDNILEKSYYKENKAELMHEVEYTSYFLFKNGEFEPISPNAVSYESVNAVWNGSELLEADFENGDIVIKSYDAIRTWKGW